MEILSISLICPMCPIENSEESPLEPPEEGFEPDYVPPGDRQYRVDLVCKYFMEGKTIPHIHKLLERDHKMVNVPREAPYHDLGYAAQHDWLSYRTPKHLGWAKELRQRHGLLDAIIPKGGGRMAVVTESADLMCRNIESIAKTLTTEYAAKWPFPVGAGDAPILRRRERYPESDNSSLLEPWLNESRGGTVLDDPNPLPLVIEVRIGVSGGRTLGKTIIEFGRLFDEKLEQLERDLKEVVSNFLAEKRQELTDGREVDPATAAVLEFIGENPLVWRRFRVELRLLFVNLVTGFDTDPFNHPIAFVTAMINEGDLLKERASMMCFSAAPFIRIGESHDPEDLPESPARVKRFVNRYGLDIIVTSAGSIDDQHSTLGLYYDHYRAAGKNGHSGEDALEIIRKHGVQGDFLWLPVTETKPFCFESDLEPGEIEILKYRPMTLMTLEELAEHVRRRHDVILVISPCGKCNESKHQILKAVLNQENRLVTHLVSDRWAVAKLLGHDVID